MRLLEEILEEIRTTESGNTTNLIIKYHDLEGENFFERMEYLRWVLNILHEEHNIRLVEDTVIPEKHWKWELPILFDEKFGLLQFNVKRIVEEVDPDSIECGSTWHRPVDNTLIQIQAIESNGTIYTKTLSGPGVNGNSLNKSVLNIFWNKKTNSRPYLHD